MSFHRFQRFDQWPWVFGLHDLVILLCTILPFPRPSSTLLSYTEKYYYHALFWFQYDALFYIHIAHHGYGQKISAFYPLLPLVIAMVSSRWLALLLLQGIFAIDLWLLSKWIRIFELSSSQQSLALILFAFNPAAVFYSTLYPEAFIVLFWLASILVAIKKTYYRASLSAGLAALSHPTGALLGIVPLFLLIQSFFYQFFHPKDQKNLNDQNNGDRKGYLVWGLGIAGGLGAFMLYSLFHWHTLFAPWTGEQRWHSQWIWPWQQYTLLLTTKYSLTQFIFWSVVSVPFLLGAGMLHRLHFPMKPAIILFTWINLLISLSFYANQDPFHSTIRLISVDFPTYAGLAALPKSLYIKIIMIIWTGYMIYGTILFTHQWWWQ